jgi:hypothetical protein
MNVVFRVVLWKTNSYMTCIILNYWGICAIGDLQHPWILWRPKFVLGHGCANPICSSGMGLADWIDTHGPDSIECYLPSKIRPLHARDIAIISSTDP